MQESYLGSYARMYPIESELSISVEGDSILGVDWLRIVDRNSYKQCKYSLLSSTEKEILTSPTDVGDFHSILEAHLDKEHCY